MCVFIILTRSIWSYTIFHKNILFFFFFTSYLIFLFYIYGLFFTNYPRGCRELCLSLRKARLIILLVNTKIRNYPKKVMYRILLISRVGILMKLRPFCRCLKKVGCINRKCVGAIQIILMWFLFCIFVHFLTNITLNAYFFHDLTAFSWFLDYFLFFLNCFNTLNVNLRL